MDEGLGRWGYGGEEMMGELSGGVRGRDVGIGVSGRKEKGEYVKRWV